MYMYGVKLREAQVAAESLRHRANEKIHFRRRVAGSDDAERRGERQDARLLLGRLRRKASTRRSTPPAPRSTPRRPVYNRLLEFKKGHHQTEPGLAESYEVSDDGLQYTFKLRPGVKFQTTDFFTPTREFNADDVVFSFERQWKEDNAWNKYVEGASWEYFAGMGMPELLEVDREGRRP
jgi:ABC-type transport system substrate-binding protein